MNKKQIEFGKDKVYLGDVIGEGAYAFVYRGDSATSSNGGGGQYGVKMIFMHSEEFIRSAKQEIEAYKMFRHRNILEMFDSTVGKTEDGQDVCYILFPYQQGGNLRQVLDNRLGARGGMRSKSLPLVLGSFKAVCEAVNVLHTHEPHYVHQDIKPDNILFSSEGCPLLMDFNSVRLANLRIDTRADALAVMEEAAAFCTISYRAPELFDPPRGVSLDPRTDVWALGCLLYAWWFGYSPFECEFNDLGEIRCVECSQLRVLAAIPTPPHPTDDDRKVLSIVSFILQREFNLRPYASDVIEMLSLEITALDQKAGFTNLSVRPRQDDIAPISETRV